MNTSRLYRLFIAFAVAVASGAPDSIAGNDIEIDEQAGDVIGEIANVVSDFRLTDLPANLQIEADSMTFDYDKGRLVYIGSVEVRHGNVELKSDELVLAFQPGRAKSLDTITAIGHVAVTRGSENASGDRAIYDPKNSTITIEGNARLGSGENTIGGETVVVHLDRKRADIKGGKPGSGGRVRAVIDPSTLELLEERAE